MSPPLTPQPIRIARAITRLGVGGAALHVALLTKHLNDGEFETRLLAGPTSQTEGDMLRLRGENFIEVHILPSLRRDATPMRDLRALRSLVRHFRAFRPDIVDTHLSKAGFLGRLAARIASVPAVHTFHVNIFSGYGWNVGQRQLYMRLEQIAARWSTRLICLSDDLGAEILSQGIGSPEQFRTISLGIDFTPYTASAAAVQRARQSLRAELGLPPDAAIIGHISRLAPVKSVKTFVQAAALMQESHPEVTFVVVGDGESRDRLEALARESKLGAQLRFLGVRADIPALNLALDVVVLTSLQEGTPISLIESLAAARPVVASDVGGVSRLVQHGQSGLLTPPNDPAAVAQALTRVLADPVTATQWGENGRLRMRREFDVTRMIEQHRALYREVAR
jgi:glycosyltransferase involved in cell wall biosynthesis